jgi:hypothetical protein
MAGTGGNTADLFRPIPAPRRPLPLTKRKPFNLTKALTKEPSSSTGDVATIEPPRAGPGETADLLRIMKSQALSDTDKFAVLEARFYLTDNLIFSLRTYVVVHTF